MSKSHLVKLELHEAVFFFSSRRRHTRFDCDWSSDVCSSDLDRRPAEVKIPSVTSLASFHPAVQKWFEERLGEPTAPQREGWPPIREGRNTLIEVGRASCRGRGEISGGGGSLKKKKEEHQERV